MSYSHRPRDVHTLINVAAILDLHPVTVRQWAVEGKIAMVPVPGFRRRFVPQSEVDRLLAERSKPSPGVRPADEGSDDQLADDGPAAPVSHPPPTADSPLVTFYPDGWLLVGKPNGISKTSWYRALEKGEVPAVKIGGRWYVARRVLDVLNQGKQPGPGQW